MQSTDSHHGKQLETFRRPSLLLKLLNPWVAIPVLVALCLALAPFLYRSLKLAEIPDIGDPFDVQAFCAVKVPDDQNAYAEYSTAAVMLDSRTQIDTSEYTLEMETQWSAAPAEYRQWLLDNRDILEVWRKGTEKADAQYIEPSDYNIGTLLEVIQSMREISKIALLDSSRLEVEGDVAGAWQTQRAVFRSSRHVGKNGCIIERLVGMAIHSMAADTAVKWAQNSAVDETLLQVALADLQQTYKNTEAPATGIKIEYVSLVNSLQLPDNEFNDLLGSFTSQGQAPSAVELFLRGEPEVGKRMIQHWIADALEECSTPEERKTIPPHLSRTMLEPKLQKSPTGMLIPGTDMVFVAIKREQACEAALEMVLAAQIYERRHGKFPDKAEQLRECGLSAVPADPFGSAGQAMQYRFDPAIGDVTIWSIGEDGVDDGGKVQSDTPGDITDLGYVISAPRAAIRN